MKMTVLPLHATPKETSQDLVQDNIDDEESKCGEYMWFIELMIPFFC